MAGAPKLHAARMVDELILRPFRYCHKTWDDGAAALRQELIDLSQQWKELGLPDSCPYQPSQKELAEHAGQYEDFKSTQEIKNHLVRLMHSNTDGWVPPDEWEAAMEFNKEIFKEFVKHMDMAEEKAKRLWPFNIE